MLNAFRNFTKSRYGLIIVFIFLGLLAIAFAASDVTGMRQGISGASSTTLATVGGQDVTERDVRDRIDRIIRNAQAQRQTMTMAQLLAEGGFEAAVTDAVTSAALHAFANQNGMAVGKKLIDSEIANNPQFAGMDGKFSQQTFESLLAQNRINPAQFRDDMTIQRYAVWLVGPVALQAPPPRAWSCPMCRRCSSAAPASLALFSRWRWTRAPRRMPTRSPAIMPRTAAGIWCRSAASSATRSPSPIP